MSTVKYRFKKGDLIAVVSGNAGDKLMTVTKSCTYKSDTVETDSGSFPVNKCVSLTTKERLWTRYKINQGEFERLNKLIGVFDLLFPEGGLYSTGNEKHKEYYDHVYEDAQRLYEDNNRIYKQILKTK